jgi:hypothetical protein
MGSWICLGGLKNDTTAPTTPVIAVTVISSTELDVSLTTPSTDAGGLKQYVLERSPNGFNVLDNTSNGCIDLHVCGHRTDRSDDVLLPRDCI